MIAVVQRIATAKNSELYTNAVSVSEDNDDEEEMAHISDLHVLVDER